MLTSEFEPWHVPLFLIKYAYLTSLRRPVLVHFEVTMRCNARCSFCDYWKTDASARADELASFADAARYFNPLLITFTGGERFHGQTGMMSRHMDIYCFRFVPCL